MKLSRNEKTLAIAFAVMSICGILFTPAGLETRPLSSLRSYALIPVFLAGTILDIASLILIFKKPRIAAVTGIVAAITYVFLAPGDHARDLLRRSSCAGRNNNKRNCCDHRLDSSSSICSNGLPSEPKILKVLTIIHQPLLRQGL